MSYCYSTNQEEFYGEFDTVEEAIAEGRDAFDDGDETVYVGEVVHAKEFLLSGKSIAENIIENIDENLSSEIYAEEAILTMEDTGLEGLGELILNYVKENADFHRWGVKNIKAY